jgi:hypothetical protein
MRKVKVRMVIAGTMVMILGLLGPIVWVDSLGTVPTTRRVCQCVNVEGDYEIVQDHLCSSTSDTYQWLCKEVTEGGPQPAALLIGLCILAFGILLTWMGLQGRGLGEGMPPSPDERWGQERPGRDLDRF